MKTPEQIAEEIGDRIGHRACTKCTAEQIWSY